MNAHQKKAVNRLLCQNGLGTLDDPGLVPQIGFLMGRACTTHEHFREMLNRVDGKDRRDMYEAMRPYLRFDAKPLDVYIAELGQLAEAKQLPSVNEDGTLAPYQPAVIDTRDQAELKLANELAVEAVAKKHLWLVCARCTKEAVFHGVFKSDCLDAARAAGWQYDLLSAKELCPDCAQ